MTLYVLTVGAVAAMLLISGYLIKYKHRYQLISGFARRSEQEQEQLIASKWPQKMGSLITQSGVLLLLLLAPVYFNFPYALEIQWSVFLVHLISGVIYLSRYEVEGKKRGSFIKTSVVAGILFLVIGSIYMVSIQDNELVVHDHTLEITGVYGDEWPLENLNQILLFEEMPIIERRVNGIGMTNVSKGHFDVEEYGRSLLFVQHGRAPYLYLEFNNQIIFINNESAEQTMEWYETLKKQGS